MKNIVCAIAVVAFLSGTAAADWDVYKSVPDVNKLDRPEIPGWPDAGDNSCWQAVAANLLGGAGYGTGANPQARADSIYNQLITDLGWGNLGWMERGVNYWLYTYGKNPASAEFKPANAYTDVTKFYNANGLTPADYNFLLDELERCQYVGVGFDNPAHALTLVGGDRWDGVDPAEQSVWHDSDRGGPGPGGASEETYTNSFTPGWNLVEYPAWNAQQYVTLCPGENKPEYAMNQYDIAYFLTDADDQDGNWHETFREAGTLAATYDDPYWEMPEVLRVDNEYVEENEKEVWLLVDYIDRVAGRQENIRLVDSAGTEWAPTVTASADDGQLLFYWDLDWQPDWERIVFPSTDYQYLYPAGESNVKDWDLSTYCIPEPTTLALFAAGGLALIRRRR